MIRLDKYLADMGVGTRSEVKQYLRKGQVTVDGIIEKCPERKIDENTAQVFFQGKPVAYAEYEYYMFHKPAGCVTATQDTRQKTVMDYLNSTKRKDLFPVGRLDIDTEGLLLITNDGPLCHQLLSPAKHVPKTYYARIEGIVTEADVVCFSRGVDIGSDEKPAVGALEIQTSDEISEILLTITEGRFHQVKRMFEAVDKRVLYLKRLAMGPLRLDETLKPGEYRALTAAEIERLAAVTDIGEATDRKPANKKSSTF